MCLTCGNVGCSRKQFDGSGGKEHGMLHFQQSKHPLACKLGTITSDGKAGCVLLSWGVSTVLIKFRRVLLFVRRLED